MLNRDQITELMNLWNTERDYDPLNMGIILNISMTEFGGTIKITNILDSSSNFIKCVDNYILIGGDSKQEPYLLNEPFYIPIDRQSLRYNGETRGLNGESKRRENIVL